MSTRKTTTGALALAAFTLLATSPGGGAFGAHRGAAATPEPEGARAAATREELANLVVMIRCKLGDDPQVGAGVIVSHAGDVLHIVTANHVVRQPQLGGETLEATDIEVDFHWLQHGWHPATLLEVFSDDLDVAVLRVTGVSGPSVPPLPWGSLVRPDAVKSSESVFPIGYPGGEAWLQNRPRYVSSIGPLVIKTDDEFLPGHSGGALATDDWGIVGLVRSAGSVGESSRIDLVVDQLREWGIPVDVTYKERRGTMATGTSDAAPPAPMSVRAVPYPPSVAPGERVAIYVTVEDRDGLPVGGARVIVSAGGGRFLETADASSPSSEPLHGPFSTTGSTKENGQFTTWWVCRPCAPGYAMTLRATKEGHLEAAGEFTVTVN